MQPPPQTFALDSVLESIRQNVEHRISHLEGLLSVQGVTTSAIAAQRALVDAYTAGFDPTSHYPIPIDDSPEHLDEAEDAAMALEVMAGGYETQGDPDLKPADHLERKSLEDFAAESLIYRDFDNGLENNVKMPLLATLSRRHLVDSFLGLMKSRSASLGP